MLWYTYCNPKLSQYQTTLIIIFHDWCKHHPLKFSLLMFCPGPKAAQYRDNESLWVTQLESRYNSQKFLSLGNPLASIFSFVRWGVLAGGLGSSFPTLKCSRGERHNLLTLTFGKSFYMLEFLWIIIKWPSVFLGATPYGSNTPAKA